MTDDKAQVGSIEFAPTTPAHQAVYDGLGGLRTDAHIAILSTEWLCPKHGEVTNWILVEYGPGYQHNGRYCQKCYVENVIVPNCERLSDVPSTRALE